MMKFIYYILFPLIFLTSSAFADGMKPVLEAKVCACHIGVKGISNLDRSSSSYKACDKRMDSILLDYHIMDATFDELAKKYIAETDQFGAGQELCSKAATDYWFKNVYKKDQAIDLETLKKEIATKYCGFSGKEELAGKPLKCAKRLIDLPVDDVVKELKEDCSQDNLNKKKINKKTCTEIGKALYVLNLDNKPKHPGLELYSLICKKTKESSDLCLEGIGKSLAKSECGDYSDLESKESQDACHKILILPS
jgi:hypothetical protein